MESKVSVKILNNLSLGPNLKSTSTFYNYLEILSHNRVQWMHREKLTTIGPVLFEAQDDMGAFQLFFSIFQQGYQAAKIKS